MTGIILVKVFTAQFKLLKYPDIFKWKYFLVLKEVKGKSKCNRDARWIAN